MKFTNFPPKSKYQTYTLFDIRHFEQYHSHRQNERRAHPTLQPRPTLN